MITSWKVIINYFSTIFFSENVIYIKINKEICILDFLWRKHRPLSKIFQPWTPIPEIGSLTTTPFLKAIHKYWYKITCTAANQCKPNLLLQAKLDSLNTNTCIYSYSHVRTPENIRERTHEYLKISMHVRTNTWKYPCTHSRTTTHHLTALCTIRTLGLELPRHF